MAREAANCNMRTQRHGQRKGSRETLQARSSDPLRMPESAFRKTYGSGSFKSKVLLTMTVVSQYYISSRKLEPKHFPFLCWILSFCICLTCPASFQPVYPEKNVDFWFCWFLFFQQISVTDWKHFYLCWMKLLKKSSSIAVNVWVCFK